MEKKGYIKTLEAVIAIVGVLLFLFSVTPREIPDPSQVPFVVENSLSYITGALSTDEALRTLIIDDEGNARVAVEILIQNNLPTGYSSRFAICSNTTCIVETPPDVSVYSDDLIITGIKDGGVVAKIVRVWFWQPRPKAE